MNKLIRGYLERTVLYQRDKLQRLEFKASVGARSFYLFIYAVPRILRDLSSLTRDRIWALTVKAPSPKYWTARDFPGGSDGKASVCNAGDLGSIPGSGRSAGEGNGNPLQYSCWRIPWTEKTAGPQSIGSKESGMTEKMFKKMTFLLTCTYGNRLRRKEWQSYL